MVDSWHQNVKNKNREEIIAAGKELFLKYNFFNVNIKDVCTLAGISRVTFYKHFKTIDELIFEVQMDILKNMTQFLNGKDKCEASGKERIQRMLYGWIDFAKNHKDQMKFIVLFDLYYEAYDSNEELKSKYENFIIEGKNQIVLNEAIIKGIKDKSLREDIDPIKTGYYIFQTIMGLLQRMSYTKLPINNDTVTFDDIAVSVVEMILNSIKNVDNN